MRILSIGECMAELAPAARDGDYTLGFAGDTFNTAWYLVRTAPDISVTYFTALGTDRLSAEMRGFMRDSGIDDSHVLSIPGKTIGLYLISLEEGERSFTYWRGQSAARALADDTAALATAMAGSDMVFFSGITLAILTPGRRAAFLTSLAEARAAGKTVAFDPNLRPRLWSSGEEMTGAIMDAARVSDVVLPSFEDEAAWFDDSSPDGTAARYVQAGATTIVVKNGPGAVHFIDGQASGTVDVTPVKKVVDTTAAGDSFNAGILAGIGADRPMTESIAAACDLAGRVVQHKGALVPFPSA